MSPEQKAWASWEVIPSGELEDASRDRLHDFRRALDVAHENGFYVFDEGVFEVDGTSAKADNIVVQTRLEEEVLGRQGNNFYISPQYAWLQKTGPLDAGVLQTAKAETSAHGVFFTLLHDPETGEGLPVAVKPCAANPDKAYIDWLKNSMAGRAGKKHFSPIGFVINGGDTFSISELQSDVETLDNSEWRQVLADEHNPAYKGQRALLFDVGAALADLHSDGIIHGDTQFKNIAVDITGKVYFIDWEAASFYNERSDEDFKTRQMAHDLVVMVRSLACTEQEMGVGLLSGFSPSLQWEYFRKYIFDPYMENMLESDSDDEAVLRMGEVEELVKSYIVDEDGLTRTIKSIRQNRKDTLDKDFSTRVY